MQFFKTNLPTILSAGIVAALFVAQNRHWLTVEQIAIALGLLHVGATPVLQRMPPPEKAEAS